MTNSRQPNSEPFWRAVPGFGSLSPQEHEVSGERSVEGIELQADAAARSILQAAARQAIEKDALTGHDDAASPIVASFLEQPTETTNDKPSNFDPDITDGGRAMADEDRCEPQDASLPLVLETSVVDGEATNQRIPDDPHAVHPLSVDELRSRLFALGISKSKDTVQRSELMRWMPPPTASHMP